MRTKRQSPPPSIGLLVAPDGRWFPNNSVEFPELLRDPDPDYDVTQFAVRNLGCIFSRSQGPLLEIVVHPRNAASAAVDAIIPLIGSSGAKIFKIRYLSEFDWREEMSTCARRTCARLIELCQASGGQPAGNGS